MARYLKGYVWNIQAENEEELYKIVKDKALDLQLRLFNSDLNIGWEWDILDHTDNYKVRLLFYKKAEFVLD